MWQETFSEGSCPAQCPNSSAKPWKRQRRLSSAMTTRAGTECIAHSLQSLTEVDPLCTLISRDGIGAFDLISLAATLGALRDVAGGSQALPCVRLFHGQPSQCLWADDTRAKDRVMH